MRGDEIKAAALDPLLKIFLRPLVRGFTQSIEFSFLDRCSMNNTSTISVKKSEAYLKDALLERPVIQEGMLSSLQTFLFKQHLTNLFMDLGTIITPTS